MPAFSFGKVGGVEFPVFFGFGESAFEALALVIAGDVEEEFSDDGAFVVEESFEGVDVFVACGPAVFVHERLDAGDEDIFVMGAVEDVDVTAARGILVDAPEEVVCQLGVVGGFEIDDAHALGVEGTEDGADGAVFAAAVHGLEDDEERVLSFCEHQLLKAVESLGEVCQLRVGVGVVEAAVVAGVEVLEFEFGVGFDAIVIGAAHKRSLRGCARMRGIAYRVVVVRAG